MEFTDNNKRVPTSPAGKNQEKRRKGNGHQRDGVALEAITAVKSTQGHRMRRRAPPHLSQ